MIRFRARRLLPHLARLQICLPLTSVPPFAMIFMEYSVVIYMPCTLTFDVVNKNQETKNGKKRKKKKSIGI